MRRFLRRLAVSAIAAIIASSAISAFIMGQELYSAPTSALAEWAFGAALILPFALTGCMLVVWPAVGLLEAKTGWPKPKIGLAVLPIAALAGQAMLYAMLGRPEQGTFIGAGSGALSAALWFAADHYVAIERFGKREPRSA